MKKLISISIILIFLNLAIYSQQYEYNQKNNELRHIHDIESLDNNPECLSGGEGTVSCSFKGGEAKTVVDCEKTCGDGEYACCGYHGCSCISYQ